MAEFGVYDLLGDPVPEGRGLPGRPEHIPTVENRNRIMLLQGVGWKRKEIAAALGVSIPTLRKHYFSELKAADKARCRVRARAVEMLWDQAAGGNVSAIGRLIDRLDRADMMAAEERLESRQHKATNMDRPVRAQPIGKKEVAAGDALAAMEALEARGLIPPRESMS